MSDLPSNGAPARRQAELISIVAPVYNEADTVEAFCDQVCAVMADHSFELVLANDGSSDGSSEILARLAAGDSRIRVVYLSRNFGHQAALTAGLDHARGDVVAMMDSDLQDPPEVLLKMIERWSEGSDVVYAVRTERAGETRLKLATASWFYRIFSRLAQIELTQNSGDFRLLDRKALDALTSLRERNRFLRGMTVWVGFTQSAVPYERDARHAGETKFTPSKMVRFSLDAISSFSHVPLQAATFMGFVVAAIAFMGIPVAIGLKIAGEYVSGVTTVLLAVLLLGGIQLITVGIIGEYLGRVYDEVKRRPLYVVRDRLNMDAPAPSERTVVAEDDERALPR